MKRIHSVQNDLSSSGTARMALLLAASLSAVASAAVIDVPGNLAGSAFNDGDNGKLQVLVGEGNSGRLLGDFRTYWGGAEASFSVPVDTNGFNLNLDTGNGNPDHVASGSISGTGSLTVTAGPHWGGAWNIPYTVSGSESNTYTGPTILNQGAVFINKMPGADALTGTVTLGAAGQTARLEWGNDDQLNDFTSVTVLLPTVSDQSTSDAGMNFLDLAGFSDAFASLILPDDGTRTQVRTGGGGMLTLNSLSVDGSAMAPGTYDSGNSSFVLGDGSVVVVPEPATLALTGLGLLALMRRRRA